MRFCLVSTQEHWGGGEALLAAIGCELTRHGHSVSTIVRQGSEYERRAIDGNALILHATKKRGLNVADWLAIRRVLRQWSPDAVVLNDSHAVPLVGSAVWACRHPRPVRLAIKHTIFRLHSHLKYRLLSDKLICVSQAALQTVLDGGLSSRHAVMIHGGCRPPHPDATARDEVRAEFSLTPDQFLIVAVGSLLGIKGHSELIEAIGSLPLLPRPIVALIAGVGEEESNLQRQIAGSGLSSRVHLLGYRNDAERLLEAADLVVHPSHSEGLSLVLIQAQMLGKPIVATAVGGTREVLAADTPQCSAWIARPQNPQSLAECIAAAQAALMQPTPELTDKLAATAARMRHEFTVETTASKLVELTAQLLTKTL